LHAPHAVASRYLAATPWRLTDISFIKGNLFGGNNIVTLTLDGDCLCWKTPGKTVPPYVDS
jgi:hypothetical protein